MSVNSVGSEVLSFSRRLKFIRVQHQQIHERRDSAQDDKSSLKFNYIIYVQKINMF